MRICYLLCNGKQVIAEIEKGTVVNPDLLKSLVPCSRSDMSENSDKFDPVWVVAIA